MPNPVNPEAVGAFGGTPNVLAEGSGVKAVVTLAWFDAWTRMKYGVEGKSPVKTADVLLVWTAEAIELNPESTLA